MATLRFLFFSCLCILAGCANLTTAPYGYVSPDREKFSTDSEKVIIPDNAPSISQGYKPELKTGATPLLYGQNETSIHEGIDIIANTGKPVLAAADGIVYSSTFGPLYGNQIVIAHGLNEDGLYYRTKYFHLQERLVSKDDKVLRGQQIGTLGMTGLLSAGFAHLHFEVRTSETKDQRLTEAVHPHKYWIDGKGNVTCFDKSKAYNKMPFRTTYPVPCTGIRWKEWQKLD